MDADRDPAPPERGESDASLQDSGRALVQLAAERTLLTWVRAAIAFMVLGFAVDRFGLLLARGQPGGLQGVPWSSWVGLVLVAIGVFASLASAARYHRFAGRFGEETPPAAPGLRLAIGLCCLLALVGSLLEGYLWLASG